jgi:phospholipid-translocating ATPase
MANTNSKNGQGSEGATRRSRWATRKMTVKSSSLKRLSLINRMHKKGQSNEKNRLSGGGESLRQDGNQEGDTEQNEEVASSRKLFFNLPLPRELTDEDGNPLQQYTRNKIRTAKYTALSFVPKNLWFQFHNVANIFFLFLVILVVSIAPNPCSCPQSPTSRRSSLSSAELIPGSTPPL